MDRAHLVYDSMLSFTQQFMIDFNIYGMDEVHLSDYRSVDITNAKHDYVCSIEHIMNADKLVQRPLGIVPEYNVIPSLDALWKVSLLV